MSDPPDLRKFDRVHQVVHRSPCRLDGLIATVEGQAGDDPMEQLVAASALAADVAQLGDSLVVHFVDAARRAGHPWSQIGAALGVTRQAAQQRFVAPDLSRFTDRARRAVDLAADAAGELGHRAVEPEHILLGLAAEGEGVAAKALEASGAAYRVLVSRASGIVTTGEARRPPETTDRLGFTPRTARLLADLAPAEATTLGHDYVGTEHVLLAVLRPPAGPAGALLAAFGVDPDHVRTNVLQLMSGYDAARKSPPGG